MDGISSKDYSGLLNDPNTPLVNRAATGVYPPASTVKPLRRRIGIKRVNKFVTQSFLSAGGSCRGLRNVIATGKWGHGHLNITKSLKSRRTPSSIRWPMTWGSTLRQNGWVSSAMHRIRSAEERLVICRPGNRNAFKTVVSGRYDSSRHGQWLLDGKRRFR